MDPGSAADESVTGELESLRSCNRGLIALSTIFALLTGREPAEIAHGVADAITSLLRPDLVYFRIESAAQGGPVELARGTGRQYGPAEAAEVGRALAPLIAGNPSGEVGSVPDPAGRGPLRAAFVPIRYVNEIGVVVACSARVGFPSDPELLLLRAAANSAAVTLHEASLRSELRAADRQKAELLEKERIARATAEAGAAALDSINRVGRALTAELDLRKLIQILTDEATRLTNAAFGAFLSNVTAEAGESYTLYTLSGAPPEAFAGFPMPQNTPLFGPTFRGEGVVRADDVTKDPRYGKNPPYHGMPEGHLPVRSYLAVPVLSRSRTVIGGLFFGHPEPGVFTAHDERIVEGLASQAAIAIDNARLFEAIESERRAAETARERAEAANRAKDEFLAMVSHELRTPLNSMLGWMRLIRSGTLDEATTTRGLATIERNTLSQAQLIEDLLDISRVITGKLSIVIEKVELESVIRIAVDSVRLAAETKEIRLQANLDSSAGMVAGDRGRLQQIVWNLLSNAIKFTPEGGEVRLRLERVGSSVEITVSDTGMGISADFLPYVFDQFRQADASITRAHGGLGLGLSIVRHLVELHGGTVRAESEGVGKGATFVVRLPIGPARREAAKAQGSRPHAIDVGTFTCPPELSGVRVLVVDDEADTRAMLAFVLGECSAVVRSVGSAADALAVLDEWEAHVLVSDIGMPGGDGYDLIREVRRRPAERGGAVPAVALTAYARMEDRMRALSAGFQMYVAKPVEPAELVVVVSRLLEFRGRIAPSGDRPASGGPGSAP